jgi:hypothetical protein
MYNWYLLITAVIHHAYGHKLQYILYIALPLIFPLLLTWHPPAVTGMVHLSPRLLVNCPLCPPLLPCTLPFPNFHPFWVFPDPNVLLIRTHPNPFPSIRHTCKPLPEDQSHRLVQSQLTLNKEIGTVHKNKLLLLNFHCSSTIIISESTCQPKIYEL